jgi:hypothetical protein
MSAIPSPVRTVLYLFTSDLADVRFGDVDGQTLARAAADVESSADVVASAASSLETARGALHERQEALLQQAQRALAYARVYAEADEALSARLDAITLPRPTRRARGASEPTSTDVLVLTAEPQPPRPRGRPRKVPALALVAATEPEPEPAQAREPAPQAEALASTGE